MGVILNIKALRLLGGCLNAAASAAHILKLEQQLWSTEFPALNRTGKEAFYCPFMPFLFKAIQPPQSTPQRQAVKLQLRDRAQVLSKES